MDVSEYILNSIKLYFNPSEAVEQLKKATPGMAFLVNYVIAIILATIVGFINLGNPDIATLGFGNFYVFIQVLMTLVGFPLGVLIVSGILHLFLMMFGAKGKFTVTFKYFLSLYLFSAVIGGILNILLLALSQNIAVANVLVGIVIVLISFALWIWYAVISVITYAKAHNISYVRSFLAVIVIPLAIALIIGVFVA
ncbi:MAG: Yip1 family protein, partial [Nanoarchaeota archaeon]